MAKKMKKLDILAIILLIVGGINWGLVGLFRFNLVEWALGSMPVLRDIVYVLVGVSAVYSIWSFAK